MPDKDLERRKRQELNQPPPDQNSTVARKPRLPDMTPAGLRSARESGLPAPRRQPGKEEVQSGLAKG